MAAALFGPSPTEEQRLTCVFVAEHVLNTRQLLEWTIAANSDKDDRRRNVGTVPIRAFLEEGNPKLPKGVRISG